MDQIRQLTKQAHDLQETIQRLIVAGSVLLAVGLYLYL